MTADTFRNLLHRKPFEPFRVVMSSGESRDVMHPKMALPTARSLIPAWPAARGSQEWPPHPIETAPLRADRG